MVEEGSFQIRFWGVRGSIACPGPRTIRYGGNTACIEIRCGHHLIILDAGTGLRELGAKLEAEGVLDADFLLSHTHFDHITGLPFFSPLFDPRNRFRFWAGHLLASQDSLSNVLHTMMRPPLFPVPPGIFQAEIDYNDFDAGTPLPPMETGLASAPVVTIDTSALNHPNGATAYRISWNGVVVCYLTDHEHRSMTPLPALVDLCRGADLVIYDSTYTDEEFSKYVGWGHSTWQAGIRLVEAAEADRLVIFHHDPGRSDAQLDAIAAAANQRRPRTIVAQEGMLLQLGGTKSS